MKRAKTSKAKPVLVPYWIGADFRFYVCQYLDKPAKDLIALAEDWEEQARNLLAFADFNRQVTAKKRDPARARLPVWN